VPNDFGVPDKLKGKNKADFIDSSGKPWKLKKNETLEELKKRAKGEKKDGK